VVVTAAVEEGRASVHRRGARPRHAPSRRKTAAARVLSCAAA
jgi:hypothetical protein